jgi:hypothetical protein
MEDELLRRAKEIAAQRDTTLTAILEQALREWLDRQRRKGRRRRVDLPVSRSGGGLLAGVNLDDTADLLDRMENDGPA